MEVEQTKPDNPKKAIKHVKKGKDYFFVLCSKETVFVFHLNFQLSATLRQEDRPKILQWRASLREFSVSDW